MSISFVFRRSSPQDAIPDHLDIISRPPAENSSTAVQLTTQFVHNFSEFFDLAKLAAMRREVTVRIDFAACEINPAYCDIKVSCDGSSQILSKPLSEYFKNALLRHSQSIYFPLFSVSKFLLNAIASISEPKGPTFSLVVNYSDTDIRSIFGVVEYDTYRDVVALYNRGFSRAVRSQPNTWDVIKKVIEAQEKLLLGATKHLDFVESQSLHPAVCDKVYYPKECVTRPSNFTLTLEQIAEDDAVRQLESTAKSAPTILNLCQTFSSLGRNFLWEDYPGVNHNFDKIAIYLNDMEAVECIIGNIETTDKPERRVLYYKNMHPVFSN